MGATDPDCLGDGLLLLIEGTYASGQLFDEGGPTSALADAANRLIESFLARTVPADEAIATNGEDPDLGRDKMTTQTEIAVLGSGCFWCSEAMFKDLIGVSSVEPGYCGGSGANPTYDKICHGDSGHIEVVRVVFDPLEITYEDLLKIFFATHDPTSRDRQGADIGSQYRSVIFTQSEEQQAKALAVINELEVGKVFAEAPIVTEVHGFKRFWPAESNHHDYYMRNRAQPYCSYVIAPKLTKLRARYARYIKGLTSTRREGSQPIEPRHD